MKGSSTCNRNTQTLRKRGAGLEESQILHDDEAIVALNQGVKQARVKLAAAQDAAEENWSAVNDELAEAVDSLGGAIEEAQ